MARQTRSSRSKSEDKETQSQGQEKTGQEQTPSGESGDYEEARQIAEKALEAYSKDDREEGDRLAEQARSINPAAVEEVLAELEEDAETRGEGEEDVTGEEEDKDKPGRT